MLCITLAEAEFPVWVLIFERLGPGSAILIFVGAVLWKLLPVAAKLLVAWRKQSEEMTRAIPEGLSGIKDLVQHVERVADHVTQGHRDSPAVAGRDRLRAVRPDPVGGGSGGGVDLP